MFLKKALTFLGLIAGMALVNAEEIALINFAETGADKQITANGDSDVQYKLVETPNGKALEVTCTPGKNGYPGVQISPENGVWDLSACGRIEANITNLSDQKIGISLRVDNAGDWKSNPWNGDNSSIPAGKTNTAKVTFGYSWGKKGFALDPAKVVKVLIFTGKPKKEIKFRINKLCAAGKAGEKPAGTTEKIKPVNGVMISFNKYSPDQIDDRGTKTVCTKEQAEISFAADPKNKWPGAFFKAPEGGIWDLSDFNQVEFSLQNSGTKPITAMCRVDNQNANGTANCATAREKIEPGAQKKVIVPFVTDAVWDGSKKGKSGFVFDSSKVNGVLVFTETKGEPVDGKLVLKEVKASAAPAPAMPEWLGRKPPVPGNWKVTFEDNFDGKELDKTKWVIPDKVAADGIHPMEVDGAKSWWGSNNCIAAKNVYVENGMMKIKCELSAKSATATDEMKKYKYVTSLAKTFGTFTQKYGYFESRMKIPAVLGMWPAFWMMPDRGKDAGIWWKRQDTINGGMEFDIMEYLGRYGPYRYNIAMHWDGYKKDHKSTGTEDIYFHTDKDGFVTSGLLWEPGKASFYVNGRLVGVYQNERIGNVPEFLMYTMPVGGWGTDGIVDDAKLPAYFEVDYVRVWQNEDLK